MVRLSKLVVLFFLFLTFGCGSTGGQLIFPPKDLENNSGMNKVFNAKAITWYGIDYSQAKLMGGESAFKDLKKIRDYYFIRWNNLIFEESKAYKPFELCGDQKITVDLSAVEARNKSVDLSNIRVEYSTKHLLTIYDVEKAVQKLKVKEKSGIGFVFVVERLVKAEKKAFMYATFFDIKTRKVLICLSVDGKCGGFGLRNYWAKPFLYTIRKTTKDYDKLKDKYAVE